MSFRKTFKKITPKKLVNLYHFLLAYLGGLVYFFPSKDMMVVGVTGTNGKSSVIEILHQIFEDFGFRVASFSSLRVNLRGKKQENRLKMTMPGRFFLQRFLKEAKNQGCQVAILEVTSEGIKQHRHRGVNFDVALLTNLRPEHIESHGSFEAYREAKGDLFKKVNEKKLGVKSISVINYDDPSAYYYAKFKADEKYGFGLVEENIPQLVNKIVPSDVKFSDKGVSFSYGDLEWHSSLVGDFNLYNIISALAVAKAFKIPLSSVKKSIEKVKSIPGRLEVVKKTPFRVVVDYAHTPDALESVFRTIKSFWLSSEGELIAVFGATGGGRDKWKRPELARIAEQFADKVILTNEDPYEEDPVEIIRDIEDGFEKIKPEVIVDRRQAIKKALATAKKGDVIIITGKGAEKMIMTAEGPVEWDDRRVVKEEVIKLK